MKSMKKISFKDISEGMCIIIENIDEKDRYVGIVKSKTIKRKKIFLDVGCIEQTFQSKDDKGRFRLNYTRIAKKIIDVEIIKGDIFTQIDVEKFEAMKLGVQL